MRKLIPIFVCSAAAFAQSAFQSGVQWWPVGLWPICEAAPAFPSPFCGAKYPLNAEPDLLVVTPQNPAAIGFSYTITGHHPDGSAVSISGFFPRSNSTMSSTEVYAGTVLDLKITVVELLPGPTHEFTP